MVHISNRWAHDHQDDLQHAFFNGIGFESWENIWGIWNQLTPRDAEALRRIATLIERAFPRSSHLSRNGNRTSTTRNFGSLCQQISIPGQVQKRKPCGHWSIATPTTSTDGQLRLPRRSTARTITIYGTASSYSLVWKRKTAMTIFSSTLIMESPGLWRHIYRRPNQPLTESGPSHYKSCSQP